MMEKWVVPLLFLSRNQMMEKSPILSKKSLIQCMSNEEADCILSSNFDFTKIKTPRERPHLSHSALKEIARSLAIRNTVSKVPLSDLLEIQRGGAEKQYEKMPSIPEDP